MRIPYTQLLGGMPPDVFLRDYWQKQPLLIRQAIPDFAGLLDAAQLRKLAGRDDAIARLVEQVDGEWQLEQGPFSSRRLQQARGRWTLLLQNANHFSVELEELFYSFDFIAHARLDDLQISLADAGGGIGPHLDSYDVFLLQAGGSKQWRIAAPADYALLPDIPLKIIDGFVAEQEWLLAPGDMLYLPPHWAHQGTAVDAGMTYSIGFRAPSRQELASQFLNFLQDRLTLDGVYADPQLQLAENPAEISGAMCEQVLRMLSAITWDEGVVTEFLGTYLTEPKPHVFFEGPARPMAATRFAKQLLGQGVRLDGKSSLLFRGGRYFCNGEGFAADGAEALWLQQLAQQRSLPPGNYSPALQDWLYDQYTLGAIHPNGGISS